MSSAEAPSRLRQSAIEVIEAYNTWDLSKMMAVRAPECINQVLPRSLGRPELDNTAYKEHLIGIMSAFTNFHVTIKELIEDTRQNKVSIWASSTSDTALGPYANEYILVFHFNDEGTKLVAFNEFVDSKYSDEFFTKLHRLMTKGNAKAVAKSEL